MHGVLFAIFAGLLAATTLAAEPCLEARPGARPNGVSSCLASGYWAELRPLDDCRFTFSVGRSASAEKKAGPQPIKFHVSGGRCAPWPKRPLRGTGTSVQCVRSGNGSTTVTLETTEGVLKTELAPLPARRVPDEPILEKRPSPPQTEILTLYRSRDYRPVEFGRGCPTCRLLAADIRPNAPDAIILDVVVISVGGSGHWFRCPATFRCGVPEFSPPDQSQISGCSGQRACRVWRLSDDESDARDIVQLTYQTAIAACRNCPPGVDYALARKRWEEAKAQEHRSCDSFPDQPVQLFGEQQAQ
jgi:hypothetical protein